MRNAQVLAATARRLNLEAGAPAIPALFFLTDPERTPDAVAVAETLPRGTAVIYRHFGAAERARVAARLARVCRRRGSRLLIAADPELALRVGAAGVHWPERRMPAQRSLPAPLLETVAAHSIEALIRARSAGMDAALLSPVFPTQSASGYAPLGLFRASQLARAAGLPVIALGGVTTKRAHTLLGRGFAGLAAVEALAEV